ncbi:MAG: hypothetical protein ACI4V5_02945 [Prevotella sp.]
MRYQRKQCFNDFRAVYPDSPSPLPDGYETTLRTIAKDINIEKK